ncbi:MAG TPA: acyl carrier protein, partial [Thermoanaerobaculia bacterium]|nr:acyl carrier protein [Thermoanaerobaculia bacterium]
VNDNFFELGGSSLLLVEIEARLRGAFHREIPIVEMFRHPTIRSLAEALEARGRPPAAAVAAEAQSTPARVQAAVAAGEGGTLARQRQAAEELRRRRASQQRSRGR